MNENQNNTQTRAAMVNALAVVGLVVLIGAGMWLAAYSARFVPAVVGSIGSAAVYLGSVFTPADEPSLSVVPTPTASTTIPFGNATTSTPTSTTTPAAPKPVQPTAGTATNGVYPISGTAANTPHGLPDLAVTISAVGYLVTSSAESFIATTTAPVQTRPAVKFTIKNIGTNVSGPWRFNASIPTRTAYVYLSQMQQPLNPGDSIEYTLGFDQALSGVGRSISITADPEHTVTESTTSNNSATAQITILGS